MGAGGANESQDPPIGWLEPWIEDLPAGGRVLDLGAGQGEAARWLAGRGFSVWAVESDPKNARRLRQMAPEEPNLEVIEADLSSLVLSPKSWHMILASAILHFLPPSDLWLLSDRLQSALRPGGILMAEVLTVDDPAYAWYRRQGRPQVEPNTYRLEGRQGWLHFFEPGELAKTFADLIPLHQEASRRAAPNSEFGYRSGALLIARRPLE